VGFKNVTVVDITPTTFEEQRKTPFMQFDSLSEFLDPSDNSKTVEGYPAPVRAVIIAKK
jgi:tRNA (mo5U34)-methyltransferase